MFLGLPDPDPFVRGTDPDPAPDQEKIKFVRLKIMCLLVSFKNIKKIFASLKSLKKEVVSEVGSG
jgi:hypothetical protein